jgi:hypothetical protein
VCARASVSHDQRPRHFFSSRKIAFDQEMGSVVGKL